MSENGDPTQVPQSLTFEPLGYLANDQSTDDPTEPRPVNNYANQLTTHIIKDASQTASRNQDENLDNSNESNFPQTFKQNSSESTTTNLDKSEYSTGNGVHEENNFDHEDIQNKMNGVIHDIQSGSTSDINTARKSVVSNHLNGDQVNNSTSTINRPSTQINSTESPLRSLSEPVLVDHQVSNEQSSPLSTRQNESSSDLDDILGIKAVPTNTTVAFDDSIGEHRNEQGNHTSNRLNDTNDFFNTKVATMDDDQRPTSATKANILDETTRFGTTSSSRAQSASSKRSVHVTPDESSISGNEKRVESSPSKLPDDPGNDTDLDNREVANIVRRPSRAVSPLNRPRSPTPNDSRKMSTSNELSPVLPAEQLQSSTHVRKVDEIVQSSIPADDNQEKQNFESPSRRESTNKTDQQKSSRPTSAMKTKPDENSSELPVSRPSSSRTSKFQVTDEQSKLIIPGEQLQIPTDDFDNERSRSPPPLPTDVQALVLVNPLSDSSLMQTDPDRSRPPSETNRTSPTTSMASNAKIIDGDVLPSKSRRESGLSQQQINNTDQKSGSRRGSLVTEQTPQIPGSRRESGFQQQNELDSHQQVGSRRTSNVPQESTRHRESLLPELQTASPRESTTIEQKPPSRKESTVSDQDISNRRTSVGPEQQTSSRRGSVMNEQETTDRKGSTVSEQQYPSKRGSLVSEQQLSNRRESIHEEQKNASRRDSISFEQHPPSKRGSTALEQQPSNRQESLTNAQQVSSRRESIVPEQQPSHRRESVVPEQQPSHRRESTVPEQKTSSHRESITDAPQVSNKRVSVAPEQQPSSRRVSTIDDQKLSNRRESISFEQKVPSRKGSATSEQQVPSKRPSVAPQQQTFTRRESIFDEQKTTSRKGSIAIQQQSSSRRESIYEEQNVPSRRDSFSVEQPVSSRKESLAPDQQISNRRESHIADQQTSHRRQSTFDQQEQKTSSKPASRKASAADQQQQTVSRRTSTNRDNQPSSPRRLSNAHVPSSQESSRHNSSIKQEQEPIPVLVNKDRRRSSVNNHDTHHQQIQQKPHSSYKEAPSSDADDVPQRTSAKHKQERRASIDKRQKSSSTAEEDNHRRPSFQRRTGQESKRNSNFMTDEIVVTPIIMDSSKSQQHNGKRKSTADSSYDPTSTSKLPTVNSPLQQEQPRRSETLNKQQIPVSNLFNVKHLSSSHATTGSEDEQPAHWTKKVTVPSIHLTDDEVYSSREDQARPQSPNVEQIAERNPVPSSSSITASTVKKRSTAEKTDGQKRKGQHHSSRRSTSVDSATHIPLVDDKSLDSASENNTDFDRHRRRHMKPKKKDVETNTDQTFDSQRLQRSFFDEKELTFQKPLKATKPMSDHFHSTRRRAPNKEQILTTPDTMPDTDRSTVRRTVKQTKDSRQDKDPVHVNVTVVVKKFAGTTKDGTSTTTAEAIVEQKPPQYFETVQHPSESLPPTTEHKDEPTERPKSTEQQRLPSSEQKTLDQHDRYTQSDTEQIITDNQKKRRRPKRISRTCQTYECVFRRMERDQQQDLRATSDTEKNIQTRKSQLRPRKKSPKKNPPVYLSTDSFRLEELLPKQYHQSRRNMSKSSSNARSLSPQGGKLLILRPTLPFHHTDAVNVQRVCLQYAIDLIPNDALSSGTMPTHRNKPIVLRQPEQMNNLPMLSTSSTGIHIPTNKFNTKEKLSPHKGEDYTHPRKNGGAV